MELTLEVKGRKLLFRFTTRAWHNLEKKVGSLNKLLNRVSGDDRPMDAMLELCAETTTAGEHYNGSKDVSTSLSPAELFTNLNGITLAVIAIVLLLILLAALVVRFIVRRLKKKKSA